jgi:hypothetical protein
MSSPEHSLHRDETNPTPTRSAFPERLWYRRLFPEDADQGDPYVLVAPEHEDTRFRFYLYTTHGGETTGGWAFTLYGSQDLIRWHKLKPVLRTQEGKACWAPAVVYIAELDRPYVMLYSQAMGSGDLAHQNQRIYRADALSPEGPFIPSGHALTPTLDFAIDPDLFERPDGSWRIICATDFDEPHDFTEGACAGTGLAIGTLNRELTEWIEAPREMVRASADWHVYNPARNDQHWKPWFEQGRPVRWYCMEAPASVDENTVIYSGGNYSAFYAMGVLHRKQDGSWVDTSADPVNALIKPLPSHGLYGTGHGMVFTHPETHETLLVFHTKYGSPDSPRQFTIVPLFHQADGNIACPPPPHTL